MRLLQAGTALRWRAGLRPSQVVLTDVHGELTVRELRDIASLLRSRRARADRLSELPADAPLRQVLATALASAGALELRSSGSTGDPHLQRRGPLTPAQLRTLLDLARRIGLRPGVRIASAAPGVHGHGLLVALGALALGAPLVDLTHLRPGARVRLLRDTSPQLLTGVPLHLADVLAADQALCEGRPLRIARVVSGSDVLGDGLRADLARHFRARVHDVYGTSEAGSLTVDGRPLAGVRIRERDGLLLVRSPFTGGKTLITDHGTVDPRGRVEVTGRADGAVSSGGMLHHPQAVARLLASHPGVAGVRLRLVDDDRYGTRTVAEITTTDSVDGGGSAVGAGTLRAEELRALVRDRLGAAAVPREVEFRDGPQHLDEPGPRDGEGRRGLSSRGD